jgi:hypothetical protein
MFQLLGYEGRLRTHVNHDPGTHNFDRDNRQAYYRLLHDEFFSGNAQFSTEEFDSQSELKTADQLRVELPKDNADFHSLATTLAKGLPRDTGLPRESSAALSWQQDRRPMLRTILHTHDYQARGEAIGATGNGQAVATYWRLNMTDGWVVPVVEVSPGPRFEPPAVSDTHSTKPTTPRATAIVVVDAGHAAAAPVVQRLLAEGRRVLAVDPFGVGEAQTKDRAYLWNLLTSSVGERPLGIIASQLAAVARWAAKDHASERVSIIAVGPRASLWALAAAATDEVAIAGVELEGTWGSLKEVIRNNVTFEQMPEVFCFGLLERFDVLQMAALVAPRPVSIRQASAPARDELATLPLWYKTLGVDFHPIPQ